MCRVICCATDTSVTAHPTARSTSGVLAWTRCIWRTTRTTGWRGCTTIASIRTSRSFILDWLLATATKCVCCLLTERKRRFAPLFVCGSETRRCPLLPRLHQTQLVSGESVLHRPFTRKVYQCSHLVQFVTSVDADVEGRFLLFSGSCSGLVLAVRFGLPVTVTATLQFKTEIARIKRLGSSNIFAAIEGRSIHFIRLGVEGHLQIVESLVDLLPGPAINFTLVRSDLVILGVDRTTLWTVHLPELHSMLEQYTTLK